MQSFGDSSTDYTVSFWFDPLYRELAFQVNGRITFIETLLINQRVLHFVFADKAEFEQITEIGLFGAMGFLWFNTGTMITTVCEPDLNSYHRSDRHVFVGTSPPLDMRPLVGEREIVRIEWEFKGNEFNQFRHFGISSSLWNHEVGQTLMLADLFHRKVIVVLDPGQRARDMEKVWFLSDPDSQGKVTQRQFEFNENDDATANEGVEPYYVNYAVILR